MEMICWGYLNGLSVCQIASISSLSEGRFVMETTTTSQRLWGTEFDKQYTKDMIRDLHKRATALIKRYERYTPRRSTDTTEDRVNTAVMKLFDRARIWDPARVA